ncbi:MAG: hypothetical protein RLZZ172_2644 [Bacteroidota bacterium]|jgi:hypothetical protein
MPTTQLLQRYLWGILFVFSLSPIFSRGQNLSGQWIGGFGSQDETSGRKTNYVLEIEVAGTKISGYSYTYFAISGKQYFVICKLSGTYDKGSKSVIVNEIENVKTNTPPDFENCLQSHQLTYLKQKDREILVGKWKPFIKESNCGSGETELERKKLERTTPSNKPEKNIQEVTKQPSQPTKPASPLPKKTLSNSTINQAPKKPLAQTKPILPKPNQPTVKPLKTPPIESKPVPEAPKPNLSRPDQKMPVTISQEKKSIQKNLQETPDLKPRQIPEKAKDKYNKRNYEVIKTIEVTGDLIKVDIYDNGQIDGDTVSIFLNEKLLVPPKMLTANPISLSINLSEDEDTYDLIMFAESLGTIPPNTAFMIITTSTSRYEINISSTEQTSGAIRFKVKR